MDYDRKPAPAPLPQRALKRARVTPVPLHRQRLEQQKSEYELSRFTARPVALQRQVAQPILTAASLRRQEEGTRLPPGSRMTWFTSTPSVTPVAGSWRAPPRRTVGNRMWE
ncbi:hypothetical protein DEDE109153_06715 [Deinococcus deserti]|uniref:Uncharacterized protein n=1 Tax=Deinococcus deserti (strain DSM 17065 / CIP 109153 / LMG 22923 / VCD115) TaxID=546414 RepID=X5H5K7_DEIDV|nr:hypothetical protein [Deinococcus deserti]AHX26535.1 hypothetical protein Deide_22532 [Deinococcus deserti VCD115]